MPEEKTVYNVKVYVNFNFGYQHFDRKSKFGLNRKMIIYKTVSNVPFKSHTLTNS